MSSLDNTNLLGILEWILKYRNQGRIKTALGPGAMTYCRAPHHNNDIYIYPNVLMHSFTRMNSALLLNVH